MEIRSIDFKRQHFNIGRIICAILFLAGALLISGRLVFGFAPEEKKLPEFQTRTLKFFIFQSSNVMAGGSSSGIIPFDIFIGEKDPVIKDAYVEITGVTEGSNNITEDIRAVQELDSFATVRAKSFSLDSFGRPNHFSFLYAGNGITGDASLLYYLNRIIQAPGTYLFEFKADVLGANISALRAKMVITYQFTPPSSGTFPVSGYVISSTFDTGITGGAAYNSLMWRGSANGGKVQMQIATSDNVLGPWDANADFKGPSCSGGSGDVYTLNLPDQPAEIMCPDIHNNKRFFRYKIILCSDNCLNAGSATPDITDVVVNWSP